METQSRPKKMQIRAAVIHKPVFIFLFSFLSLFFISNIANADYPNYYFNHTLVSQNGSVLYKRICPANATQGIIWNACAPFSSISSASLGLGSINIASTGDFYYQANGAQFVLQIIVGSDGISSWTRKCSIDDNQGFQESGCNSWSYGNMSGVGLGNNRFSVSNGYVYWRNGQQILLQNLVSQDGTTAWSRECQLSFNGTGDINWSVCSSGWNSVAANSIGLGNIQISYSGGIVQKKNNQQYLLQTIIRKDGALSWNRDCPIDSSAGIQWGSCSSWNQIDMTAIGFGNLISSQGFMFGINSKLSIWSPEAVDQQARKAIDAYLAANPIENLPGLTNTTITQIYAQNISDDEKVRRVLEHSCGTEPSSDQEAIASWKSCAGSVAFMLMDYYTWKENRTLANAFAYAAIFHIDSLSATDANPPFHGLSGSQYRLGNSNWTQSYLNDFGTGVFTGFGWAKSSRIIDQAYCTTLEQPYDAGKNCKTIDLYARVRNVLKNTIIATENYKNYRQDANYLGRNAAGRAAAAVVSGDQSLTQRLRGDAEKYIYDYWGSSTPSTWNVYDARSDNFQLLQTVLNIFGWATPDTYNSSASIWSDIFFGTYFNQTHQISDVDRNSYIANNIPLAFPGTIVRECGQSGISSDFYNTSAGITTGIRGESLSDALITSGPGLYWLLKNAGQNDKANSTLDVTAWSLNVVTANPPSWQNEMCNPAQGYGNNPKNHFEIAMRVFAYLYFAHQGLARAPVENYIAPLLPDATAPAVPSGLSVN